MKKTTIAAALVAVMALGACTDTGKVNEDAVGTLIFTAAAIAAGAAIGPF